MIQVPNSFRKFMLEYEYWRKEWKAWALIDKEIKGEKGDYAESESVWFLGTGANPDLAAKDLFSRIQSGKYH
jgi:hypothetical protein